MGHRPYKALAFRRIERQTATFLDVFRRSTKFSEVQAVCKSLEGSPLVGMFQAGYAELNLQLRPAGAAEQSRRRLGASYLEKPAGGGPGLAARIVGRGQQTGEARALSGDDRQHHAVHRPVRHGLGHHVGVLQTSVQQGSTDLAVVAPGIAEALIATAAGLFAAIPAVYFYNHFTTKVKVYASEMDDFALEFLNIAERNFTVGRRAEATDEQSPCPK